MRRSGCDGADFVVPIGADHQQGLHIPLGQEILEHSERSRIEPLQIVEEERQRMVRPGEHTDEPPEHQLETPLRVLRRELRHGRLVADEERQCGDEVHHEPSVRLQRLTKRGAPAVQLGLALPQKVPDEALKRLRERRIRDVALVLVKLACGKEAAGRHEHFMQLVDDGGLADAGRAGDQHQLRHPARHDAVEGREQRVDLARAPIEFLGHHQPVRRVVCAEREGVDPALGLPLSQAAPEVALEASRGLIAVLGGLGEQLHDDRRDGAGDLRQPLGRRRRPPRDVAVHPFHRLGRREGQTAGQHFVQRDAERVEVAARIDRSIHPPGLFGRHVGQCARDELGRGGRLALARQARRDAKAQEPDLAGRPVDEHMGRLDILVDQAPPVELAQRDREPDGDAQPLRYRQWAIQEARERLTPRVGEDEHGPPLVRGEGERPDGPAGVELGP